MKVFLASAADKTLHLLSSLAKITPQKTKVAFIANASDLYTRETPWIDADRNKFRELGYSVTDVDLRRLTKTEIQKELTSADIIHVCGGNLLYLLSLFQEKDIVDLIRDAVVKSGKIYTGTSAGSMIAAPSVELEKYSSETLPETLKKLKGFKGLGLAKFLVVPHSENPDFASDSTQYVKHVHEHGVPLFFIYDSQAVWIDGDGMRLMNA